MQTKKSQKFISSLLKSVKQERKKTVQLRLDLTEPEHESLMCFKRHLSEHIGGTVSIRGIVHQALSDAGAFEMKNNDCKGEKKDAK
jgi:hypothetical protein